MPAGQAAAVIREKGVVQKLFDEIGARFADRQGGYTRIVKTGFRAGDSAPMAVIELTVRPSEKKDKKQATAKKETKPRQRRKAKKRTPRPRKKPSKGRKKPRPRRQERDQAEESGGERPAAGKRPARRSKNPLRHAMTGQGPSSLPFFMPGARLRPAWLNT